MGWIMEKSRHGIDMSEGFRERKIFIIVNRLSGGGRADGWWRSALPILAEQGLDFFWQFSEGGRATSAQVRRAVLKDKATAVLVVGGDGHIHDTVNGLIEDDELLNKNLALGIYPAGSGCDFARMIYKKSGDNNTNALLDLLLNGQLLPIDVGRADFFGPKGEERWAYFINGSDIGLGAATAMRVNARGGLLKRLLRNGQLAFLLAAIQALLCYCYMPMCIEADGEKLDGQYLIAAVGNGGFMGGNMRLFPQARLDDGLLEIFLVHQLPKVRALLLFAKVYNGTVLEVAEVCHRRARKVSLVPAESLPLELDGELPGFTPLHIRVLPRIMPLLTYPQISDYTEVEINS
jgi:YegS/Rv2252/BmrU family lipid kinase